MKQKPSIGRIVHYTWANEDGDEHCAAIITGVNDDDTINLMVFAFEGMFPIKNAKHSEPDEDGMFNSFSWHFPERI